MLLLEQLVLKQIISYKGDFPLSKHNKVINLIIFMSKAMLFICLKKKEICQTFWGRYFTYTTSTKLKNILHVKKNLKCINLTIPGKPCYLFLILLLNHSNVICQNLTYKSFIYVLASVLLIIFFPTYLYYYFSAVVVVLVFL